MSGFQLRRGRGSIEPPKTGGRGPSGKGLNGQDYQTVILKSGIEGAENVCEH